MPTPGNPRRAFRLDDETWKAFGEAAELYGWDRGSLVKDFVLWFVYSTDRVTYRRHAPITDDVVVNHADGTRNFVQLKSGAGPRAVVSSNAMTRFTQLLEETFAESTRLEDAPADSGADLAFNVGGGRKILVQIHVVDGHSRDVDVVPAIASAPQNAESAEDLESQPH